MQNYSRLEKQIGEAINQLEKEIRECEAQLQALPEGTVEVSRKNQKNYYVHYYEMNGKKFRRGVTKQEDLVKQLAMRDYCSRHKKECELRLKALQEFKNQFGFDQLQNETNQIESWKLPLIETLDTRKQREIEAWIHSDYPTNPYKTENRIIKTQSGVLVRSKSEREIANCLQNANIPFRYEAELLANGEIIYPDFTILNPRNGKLYYWEHAGMIDSPDYVNSNYKRFSQYASIGAYIDENLIYTTEDKGHPLETELIERLIDFYFR